jgi:hypothetical protein
MESHFYWSFTYVFSDFDSMRVLGSLNEKGIIVRVGPNKGGSWKFST